MFAPITIPYDSKMLFNVVKLKDGYTIEDAELAMGEMCNVVKETYGHGGGFIAGQVFNFTGFVSDEGSFDSSKPSDDHIAIITYWESFEQHERSHADHAFKEKFDALKEMCDDAYELGYEMMWQDSVYKE